MNISELEDAKLLTVAQCAEILNVSPKSVYRWLSRGDLKKVVLSTSGIMKPIRVPLRNLKQFIKEL